VLWLAQFPHERIPDEQGRIEDDGNLTIFVALPDGREIALRVPREHWAQR
jgi:hypothetical protein